MYSNEGFVLIQAAPNLYFCLWYILAEMVWHFNIVITIVMPLLLCCLCLYFLQNCSNTVANALELSQS